MSQRSVVFQTVVVAAVSWPSAFVAADVVVLKETDRNGQPKRIVGRIVETQTVGDKEAVLVESDGKRRLVLKLKIDRIEPSINEKELERLDPTQPARYLELGVQYAQQAEELNDVEARECAKHLLSAAMELDAPRYAADVHLRLAQLADGSEGMQHIIQVLRDHPENTAARNQLRELTLEQSKQATQNFDDLRLLLRSSLQENRWAPLVSFAKSHDAPALFGRLEWVFPGMQGELAAIALPTDCPVCKGSTRIRCEECRGGRVPCSRCNGRGALQTTQSSSFTDPVSGNVIVNTAPARVRCTRCNGQKTFPCERCKDGWLTCTACGAAQKTVNVSASLRQRLDDLSALLNQPHHSSWAQTLLIEDRAPFRSVASQPGVKAPSPVEGRYYRRSGRWQTTP